MRRFVSSRLAGILAAGVLAGASASAQAPASTAAPAAPPAPEVGQPAPNFTGRLAECVGRQGQAGFARRLQGQGGRLAFYPLDRSSGWAELAKSPRRVRHPLRQWRRRARRLGRQPRLARKLGERYEVPVRARLRPGSLDRRQVRVGGSRTEILRLARSSSWDVTERFAIASSSSAR